MTLYCERVIYILLMFLAQEDPPVFLLCIILTPESRLDGTVTIYSFAMYSYGRRKPTFKMPGPEMVESFLLVDQSELPGSTQPKENKRCRPPKCV